MMQNVKDAVRYHRTQAMWHRTQAQAALARWKTSLTGTVCQEAVDLEEAAQAHELLANNYADEHLEPLTLEHRAYAVPEDV